MQLCLAWLLPPPTWWQAMASTRAGQNLTISVAVSAPFGPTLSLCRCCTYRFGWSLDLDPYGWQVPSPAQEEGPAAALPQDGHSLVAAGPADWQLPRSGTLSTGSPDLQPSQEGHCRRYPAAANSTHSSSIGSSTPANSRGVCADWHTQGAGQVVSSSSATRCSTGAGGPCTASAGS